ncbi:MAG: chemotaxis response regulator containing a CheY-like receiver domain and a methylesterase domain [Acidimicrobiaceae bacterium]|nr:chemotaxis response regulator containing a CheY-like receiver domain and a methylesterase domain [Acidimicrobiaceae bacterium]
MQRSPFSLVVVGCSRGGLAASRRLLEALRRRDHLTMVIVQHRGPEPSPLVSALASASPFPVSEAEDKEPLLPRRVYVAPPGYHLLIEDGHFELSTEAPIDYSRPSIDVTFASAARAFTRGVVGVVMTGGNSDGAKGAAEIVRRGGKLVVQDPSAAEAPDMPRATLEAGLDPAVAPLEELGAVVRRLALQMNEPAGAQR